MANQDRWLRPLRPITMALRILQQSTGWPLASDGGQTAKSAL